MRKETVDIIEDLLTQINKTIEVKDCTDNFDGTYTIRTCDTLYLKVCDELTIDGRKYSVVSTTPNNSIVLKGKKKPEVSSFDIPAPTYFHGKAIDTNAELDMIDDKDTITPLVYLTEIYTDRFYPNDELIERTVDIRMFFLTTANYEDWKTNDHYTGAILPMRSLAYNFIETLEKSKIIGKFASYYDLTNHAKFGIFILRKGATKRIFDDNFSGVEFSVRLPILKDMTCEGFCE
jgi:hypothetical protein